MTTFTRKQLRTRQTDGADFADGGDRDFSLVNNSSGSAYFNIEGLRLKGNEAHTSGDGSVVKIFDSCSISSPVSCSFITESTHGGFVIEPGATATFTLEPTEFITSSRLILKSSNVKVLGVEDKTNSGSYFGVTLNTDA
tara:strand:- start:295 stop:711 length:417 start_codon:yes stop_codon:yes gene_type:complete